MARKSTSTLCSNCGKLISVEENRCPHCGVLRPALFGFGPALRRLFGDQLDLVHTIAVACGALYAISLALDPDTILQPNSLLRIGAPSNVALFLVGMTGDIATRCGHHWTLLTANFLHGSILHIFFNVMWIRALGPTAVSEFGAARFFVIYMVTGVAGFALSNLLSGAPTVGASAAIFGLMGVLGGHGLRRNGRLTAYLSFNTLRWAAIIFVWGLMGTGINAWAHTGGLLAGFAMAWMMPRGAERREPRAWQLAALVLIVATVAAFGFSAWSVWGYHQTGGFFCLANALR